MARNPSEAEHQHNYPGHAEHDLSHGVVDPALVASERGIWAVKWSFIGLLITALVQVVVVFLSGTVALLSDTIYSSGAFSTGTRYTINFSLSRLGASRRIPFCYGRVQYLTVIVRVQIILLSAVVAD